MKLTVLRKTDIELRQGHVFELILYNDHRFTVMDQNLNEDLVNKNLTLTIRSKYEGKKDSNYNVRVPRREYSVRRMISL